jgi:hypothetical protein
MRTSSIDKLALEQCLGYLNNPLATKKYVGLALAVKILKSTTINARNEGEEKEEEEEDLEIKAGLKSICSAVLKDDFLLSLIINSQESTGTSNHTTTTTTNRTDYNDREGEPSIRAKDEQILSKQEKMQMRSLGINVLNALSKTVSIQESALIFQECAFALCRNDVVLPRDSLSEVCEFLELSVIGFMFMENSDVPLADVLGTLMPNAMRTMAWIFESTLDEMEKKKKEIMDDGNKVEIVEQLNKKREEMNDKVIISALNGMGRILLVLLDAGKKVPIMSSGRIFTINVFDPVADPNDSDDELSPPIETAEIVSRHVIGRAASECLYGRAGTPVALKALEFLDVVGKAGILCKVKTDTSIYFQGAIRYQAHWRTFKEKWSHELREGLKLVLLSKYIDRKDRYAALDCVFYVAIGCSNKAWMLEKSSSSKINRKEQQQQQQQQQQQSNSSPSGPDEISLYEIVTQLCRVEIEVELYHLIDSDDSEIRKTASDNLKVNLQLFGYILETLAQACGDNYEDEEEEEKNVANNFAATKSFENLGISAETATKQVEIISSVVGKMLEAMTSEILETDVVLTGMIALTVLKFAEELPVAHVSEIDRFMYLMAEHLWALNDDARIEDMRRSSVDFDNLDIIICFGHSRILYAIEEMNEDPERVKFLLESGFVSLLFRTASNRIDLWSNYFNRPGLPEMLVIETMLDCVCAAKEVASVLSELARRDSSSLIAALGFDPVELNRIRTEWIALAKNAKKGKELCEKVIVRDQGQGEICELIRDHLLEALSEDFEESLL